MENIKDTYIFLDIDGTILDHRAKDIYKDTKESIRQAQANGAKVFINTGRSYSEIPKSLINFGFDGYVCALGTYIIYENKVIYDKRLGKENVEFIRSVFKDINCIELYEGIKDNYVMLDKGFKWIIRCAHIAFTFNSSLCYKMNQAQVDDITKMTVVGIKLGKWLDILEEKFNVIVGQGGDSPLYHAEVTTLGHNKASGIATLKKVLKNDNAYTICIGDSNNDKDMLQYCDMSYCMGNGSAKAKQYAKKVTSSIKNNGVGQALKDCGVI